MVRSKKPQKVKKPCDHIELVNKIKWSTNGSPGEYRCYECKSWVKITEEDLKRV